MRISGLHPVPGRAIWSSGWLLRLLGCWFNLIDFHALMGLTRLYALDVFFSFYLM